jgi:hypothetical protein
VAQRPVLRSQSIVKECVTDVKDCVTERPAVSEPSAKSAHNGTFCECCDRLVSFLSSVIATKVSVIDDFCHESRSPLEIRGVQELNLI